MAYQGCDTFDHYNTPSIMYEFISGAPVISGSFVRYPAVGSYPNQGLHLPSNALVRKNLPSNQATLIAFLSFGADSLPNDIISFLDNATYQVRLTTTPAGALRFINGAGVTLATSANGLIGTSAVPNHGIEVFVVISNTVGQVLCYLDGVLVIPLTTGLDTQQSANAFANQVQLGATGINSSLMTSDYWRVWDNTGSFQNAPVGLDRRKLTKLPTGVGDLSQWTPNGAGANWQCVNNNPPDGDTTYVSSGSTLTDSYGMGTSGLGTVPSMVVAKSYVRKDDSTTRALQVGVRSVGVNGLGSPIDLGTSYVFVDSCISVDPNTGVPPTAAAADAYQHCKFEST